MSHYLLARGARSTEEEEEGASAAQEFTIDLRLYTAVLWRHRVLVIIGLNVAVWLALLSVVRVSPDGVAYRKPEVWSNASLLSLEARPPKAQAEQPATAPLDLSGLVDLYAAFVTRDDVVSALKRQRLLEPEAGVTKALPIAAVEVPSAVTGAPTPLLKITASAETPAAATRLTTRATDTFIKVTKARQIRDGIQLDIVTRAEVPQLIGPRSKTTPILVFLACMTVVIAAAFIRDNTQRKGPPHQRKEPHQLEAAPDADSDPTELPQRRTSSGSSR